MLFVFLHLQLLYCICCVTFRIVSFPICSFSSCIFSFSTCSLSHQHLLSFPPLYHPCYLHNHRPQAPAHRSSRCSSCCSLRQLTTPPAAAAGRCQWPRPAVQRQRHSSTCRSSSQPRCTQGHPRVQGADKVRCQQQACHPATYCCGDQPAAADLSTALPLVSNRPLRTVLVASTTMAFYKSFYIVIFLFL